MAARNHRIKIGLAAVLAAAFAGIAAAQSVRETPLDELPAVDRDRAQSTRSSPPPPPPIPRAPRVNARTAPPAYDDAGPPARETPTPGARTPPAGRAPTSIHTRTVQPPPPPPAYRAAPRDDEARPAPAVRRTEPARRRAEPRGRSAFYANCTQQCHLACEASFEICNIDASPAKPECVRKLETCRAQRCSCTFD